MERKAYLINKSFGYFMFASIMSMTAMNLNSIIDGIIMGNLLGENALSAINVVLPIVNCISAVGVLLSQGPSMKMATYLGALKKDRANQIFTVSIVSMLIVGLFLSVVMGVTNLPVPIVRKLCVAQNLNDLALRYATVLMAGAILLIFENGLSTLVDVMGNPKIVSFSMLIKMGINIVFDILNIKVLGMDIAGAAYATLFSSLIADAIFVFYIVKKSDIRLCSCPEWHKDLGGGIIQSVPGFIGSLSSVALMFICNYFIMANQGSDGMFVMSIGYTLISIGSIISNGVGMTYAAIGGTLLGQEDYFGMRALFKRGILVTLLTPVLFNIVGLFSGSLAVAYGATSQEVIELSRRSLPMICIMLFSLGVISSMIQLHTVLEHRTVSSVNTLLIIISVVLAFVVSEHIFAPENIWYAFPLATAGSLFVFIADTTAISIRSKGQLQLLSLIPRPEQDGKLYDVSVECNMNAKGTAIDGLIAFLNENGVNELENSVVHSLDELMMNIVSFSGRGDGAYMDLSVMIRDDRIMAFLKNDGKPFDPLSVNEKDRKSGLKMVFHFCENLEYRYSFGQNLVLASWKRT